MVPTPLIMLPLAVAFFPGTFGYLFAWPQRRLANWYFAHLAACSGGMIFVLTLSIFSIRIVWLSWVLLAGALALVFCSVRVLRSGHAALQRRERATAEMRARGH